MLVTIFDKWDKSLPMLHLIIFRKLLYKSLKLVTHSLITKNEIYTIYRH